MGAIVYDPAGDGEALMSMGGERAVSMPGGSSVSIAIPAVFVDRQTAAALREGRSPVTGHMSVEFNGWGYLRLFDISDPERPVRLGTFATANTMNEAAPPGSWSAHNPEMWGDFLVASWYGDGVRMIDISNPREPREVASWTGAGAPPDAPPVNIWSVVPHGDLLLASDLNFGLYVLTMKP